MPSHPAEGVGHDEASSGGGSERVEPVACNGCRKAKLRCSRETPFCMHCRKTGLQCVYETKRVKPGLKAGAVENLHRRLDALEELVHNQSQQNIQTSNSTSRLHEPNWNTPDYAHNSAAYNVLSLLATELPKLIPNHASKNQPAVPSPSHQRADSTSKRRRLDGEDDGSEHTDSTPQSAHSPYLPDSESLEAIISAYFCHVHPWIPMVHQERFRRRIQDATERIKLHVVLHAMVIAAAKFVPSSGISTEQVRHTRKWVVWTAMDCLSPESFQALIILAFTDIGNGEATKAWSLIGSLTRTVEYTQLTVEADSHNNLSNGSFCRPHFTLPCTSNWTETEERRRIFWNVFNLDRFCSVTMGWNTSLTSDDVHRRLPCDGHLWREQRPVTTPYFGIWDKSAGRIGNPITFLPSYEDLSAQVQPDAVAIHNNDNIQCTSPTVPFGKSGSSHGADMSTVGAFAYCIEATESMSRIMSYFLQQKVNIHDQREISSWLTRFKELDLRLVHWKMLLPQKWKSNPNLARQDIIPLIMDPNLTLAHVTHNASMILLHQLIAYPPSHWDFRNRLPSSCSTEACYGAGTEIANITQNYLQNSHLNSPVGSQYSFCVFIAARVLLIHWRHSPEHQLPQEFWSLVHSLEQMSRRWRAYSEIPHEATDLSANYAHRLKKLHEKCTRDESFRIEVMDFTNDDDQIGSAKASCAQSPQQVQLPSVENGVQRDQLQPGVTTQWPVHATPSLPDSITEMNMHMDMDVGASNSRSDGVADFNIIPQMMSDQHFMNMDRVIAFDDGSLFAATLDNTDGW